MPVEPLVDDALADPTVIVATIPRQKDPLRHHAAPSAPAPACEVPRVLVGGIAFHALREDEVIERVFDELVVGRGGTIVTPNLDILRQVERPEVRHLVEDADLVVPDGMPIIWASRLLGDTLPERVSGSSMVWTLSAVAA